MPGGGNDRGSYLDSLDHHSSRKHRERKKSFRKDTIRLASPEPAAITEAYVCFLSHKKGELFHGVRCLLEPGWNSR